MVFRDGAKGVGQFAMVVRLAATGDLHVRPSAPLPQEIAGELTGLRDRVDALVVAGDITDGGRMIEAERAAEVLGQAPVPVIAVFGNHDLRSLRRRAFRKVFEQAGVVVLDGESVVITGRGGERIGFAGVGGSGGGFWPLEGPDGLSPRAFRRLALRAEREAARLDAALTSLAADVRIAVTHFAPTTSTLGREPAVKYWMLGNCELGRVIDRHAVDLVIHGHAHLGNEFGSTIGGTPVRNAARTVIGGIAVHELRAGPARAVDRWRRVEMGRRR
jgi:Icc-related predicted phosphoesterase